MKEEIDSHFLRSSRKIFGRERILSALPDCFIFADFFWSNMLLISEGKMLCFFRNEIKLDESEYFVSQAASRSESARPIS